jgi:hypothetical protein
MGKAYYFKRRLNVMRRKSRCDGFRVFVGGTAFAECRFFVSLSLKIISSMPLALLPGGSVPFAPSQRITLSDILKGLIASNAEERKNDVILESNRTRCICPYEN